MTVETVSVYAVPGSFMRVSLMNQASTAPSLLIILDINGTLVSRLTKSHEHRLANSHPLFRKPDVTVNGYPIYFRPGLRSFLSGLFKLGNGQHRVAIWTSAMAKNAVPMVVKMFGPLLDYAEMHDDFLADGTEYSREIANLLNTHFNSRISQKKSLEFGDGEFNDELELSKALELTSISPIKKKKLSFIWSQGQCEVFKKLRKSSEPFSDKPEFRKDLDRVWSSKGNSHSPLNTLIIDDSAEKIDLHPLNHMNVSTFSVAVDPSLDFTTDDVLDRLLKHLQILVSEMEANPNNFDVREFNRTHPFSFNKA